MKFLILSGKAPGMIMTAVFLRFRFLLTKPALLQLEWIYGNLSSAYNIYSTLSLNI